MSETPSSSSDATSPVVGAPVVGAIVPLRLSSTRLPRKPLLDVAGATALQRVTDRAAACPLVTRVIVATTELPADDDLAAAAVDLGLDVFRGPERDVLRRITEAAVEFDLDVVVEVDGDDLLCATEYMTRGVELLDKLAADYVAFAGLPLGATPNVLRRSALENAVAWKDYADTETGIFRFLEQSGRFRVEAPTVKQLAHIHPTVRMTLDYPVDLMFFRAMYARLDALEMWTFADLVAILRREPVLIELNAGLDEAYVAHFNAGLHRPATPNEKPAGAEQPSDGDE